MRNLGSVNNTIIHECVHWELHRKYFELVNLYNEYKKYILCNITETTKPKQGWSPYEIMEWQANALAPRILMPAKQTKEKIEELIEKNKKVLNTTRKTDILESVIYELADFFGVSKLAAKIRMIDLGYHEVEGIYLFVDNHYVTSYISEQNALKNNQTYTIEVQDALFLLYADEKFKETVKKGNFIFIDNHFCINDSKYIKSDELGNISLTDYAREHIEECCLIFDFNFDCTETTLK
ncbi:MAG: ImmA/IrrE family metallo-endopeptidase [Armatimonadota bacterium]